MATYGRLRAGFTLIELLIAMSIMLMMLVLAATAYQLYTDSWKRDLSKVEQRYQTFRGTELLLDAIQATLPLSVTNQGGRAYYFLGREEGFTAVTYAPIHQTGSPAVIRVFRELNDNGRFKLVYEEASLVNTVLKDADQVLPFSYRAVCRLCRLLIMAGIVRRPKWQRLVMLTLLYRMHRNGSKNMMRWLSDYTRKS